MTTLTVGVGEQYATIAAAVAATQDGDTVLVNAGTYTNDFVTISHNITLKSVGGQATLAATSEPPNGKAIMTVDNSAVIDGFGFTGAVVGDNNGAGIRYEAGNLVVRNSVFWDNQDGLLAAGASTGTILIQNSEFSHNGAGDGYTHNIYVGAIASLTIEGSYFHDAVVGHEIKSRAVNTTIIDNRIEDNQGNGSYSIDLPNGGNAVIQGNTIEKGANAENYTTIAFGAEGNLYAGSSLKISGNTLVNDNANGILLHNYTANAVTLSNNQIWGYAATNLTVGAVTQTANTTLSNRPTLDTTTMAPAVVAPLPPPPVILVPGNEKLETWGTAGAVVAFGHVLTVGAHGEFGSLGSALAASVDGDTIEVAAGTYTNDIAAVNHKVIIEGVGGLAKFVQTGFTGAQGLLVVNTDVTLKNLEFMGGANYDANEGGVTINGGNVTIDNSLFVGNDTSIRAINNASETLSIYNSEFSGNGNAAKGTNGMVINSIASFTMQGSYVHNVVTGHEISDHAFNTDIENSRIIDGAGTPASDLIDLGQGGNAIIKDNVLEKGVDAQADLLINVGGEGTTYSNSDVQISGNTLISDMVNYGHPYTYFIVGENDGSVPPITATGNVFVGGIQGSQELMNATGSNNTVGQPITLDTSSPVSAAAAPPLFTPAATGAHTLTLSLTDAKNDVDAQFDVLVDGTVVGGGTVTAPDGGAPELFSYTGDWSVGAHTVEVKAVNTVALTTGVSTGQLSIKTILLDNNGVSPAIALSGGNSDYTTSLAVSPAAMPNAAAAPASTLVLHLSEDAYAGDAQFSVNVDGVTLGSPQSVTALHNAGQSQAFTFTGNWAAGSHNVAVSFLNDAYGGSGPGLDRNLYVNSVDMNGTSNANASATFYQNGTQTLNVAAGDVNAPAPADTLVLNLSEDAYLGDAQFLVAVDGKQQGGVQSVSALRSMGQTEAFTFAGSFGAGPHDLALTFLNDAYGGNSSMDRNLYMNSLDIDGQHNGSAVATLYANGTAHVQFIVPHV